jgi:serine/threonine-protein kinase PknG
MTVCPHFGCAGEVDEVGWCSECGRSAADVRGVPSSEDRMFQAAGGLISVPVFTGDDPSSRVISDPATERFSRRCRTPGCHELIGSSYAGQPALLKGFCQKCGAAYDFEPRLTPGDVVAGQYEIIGPIAHGGQGWVYVARDRHLDGVHVALKGLIEPDDPIAVSLAISERRFLISLDHPNVVRIYNFVSHDDERHSDRTGYIVMEYLNGQSLREVLTTRRSGGRQERLRLEHVLAYGYEILIALDYLHRRGLLYCDMKPDNVVLTAERIKLIDVGGVRRFDEPDLPLVATSRYGVGKEELRQRGATVRSDIYGVGKTLEELFTAGWRSARAERALESCQRLIKRAADPEWDHRFESAAQMLEQLRGVLTEVMTLELDQEPAAFESSALFELNPAILDGGLSEIPPLERWTRQAAKPFGEPPETTVIALGLPVPRVDPVNPDAGLLASIGPLTGQALIDHLVDLRPAGEIALRLCRAYLELGEPDQAEQLLGDVGPGWRLDWHGGLIALARNLPEQAFEYFDEVYSALPGETAPKLALGLCREHLGDHQDLPGADGFFEAVWRRDRSQTNAAFGLARLRLGGGDRSAAVRILAEVPKTAQHRVAAAVAAVRILSEVLPGGNRPSSDDLARAARSLKSLILEDRARDRLSAVIREARFHDDPSDTICQALEESYMRLALQAATWHDKGRLVDLAHSVHPWSLL